LSELPPDLKTDLPDTPKIDLPDLVEVKCPDLKAVINAWPDLPDAIRSGIVAMVNAAKVRR